MLKQIEGSRAIAEAVALCRPEVICAYPITPQTHIVENLGAMVKAGDLAHCEFINVESEFAALSSRSAPAPPVRGPIPPPPARACCSWPRRCTTRRASACRS
jgi:TPP-dependent indolepyruvate ferredoxin oxidoreductase alpha subunit